ncbi:hypothetical protein HQ602_04965 [Rhodococcus kroppenstedtii]|uniref:hypothetical protein n=1 Tax=Rhodococcoides kroppenstedtii TaxID=293050 RepID=UPI001C9A3A23|nr:hypothetical protein [Rhodococcus kroppenstedtii]MBY6435726.1 hypothetical protein [Rhodococcus kroppenstedtii]
MAVNVELEFRLLYDLDDDWMPFWGFGGNGDRFLGYGYAPREGRRCIRWFAETGLMTLGALADNEYGWEEWDVDLDESMERIANGTASGVGYNQAAGVADLMTTEVFRASITEKGERRLAELEE